ncbi:MAG: polysaccharide biosynthesis/export family protein [Chitinivibrionales bacterium]|nr:polysaccharide biosynthesis/export family protein [Chitinivibrionales bacterium]
MQIKKRPFGFMVILFIVCVSAGYGDNDTPAPFKKGDAVRIAVLPDTSHFVNGVYRIDNRGSIFLPVIGFVRVDTLSLSKLTGFLDTTYMSYLRYPNLYVRPLIRVSLLGGFIKPGMYFVDPEATLWDALAQAGGPVREDGLKKICWERDGTTINDHLLPQVQAGTTLEALGIKSGDQITLTHEPKLTGWENFTVNILPALSFSVTAVTATATVYIAYLSFKGH